MTGSSSSSRYRDLLARLDAARGLGVSLGLERVRAALAALDHPQRAFACVHIAGTNGKGSTAAMTAALLRAAGLRTGLYTSPHLSRFTERIVIDGREVDGDLLAELDARVRAAGIPLTYFEVATVLAFLAFAHSKVEVAVLETGLGGRLDATTACDPVATAITSIALDHLELLGPTLRDIAREKAGIAKPGVPLWLATVPPEADAEIARAAAEVGAPLWRLGQDFPALPATLSLALRGEHQRGNAAIALALARAVVVGRRGARDPAGGGHEPELTEAQAARALGSVSWPGRLELVPPDVLLDCAHNPDGAAALKRYLLDSERGPTGGVPLPSARLERALVFSVVDGKDVEEMLRILVPGFAHAYATRSSSPRALDPESLRQRTPAAVRGRVRVMADPVEAIAAARAELGGSGAPARDGAARPQVVVAGSTFLVGDVRAALLGEARDPIVTSDPMPPPSGAAG